MRNITVSVPDEVYRRARIKAAEQNSSVSSLVKEFLTQLTDEGSHFEKLERLQEETLATIHGFRAQDRLPREDLHSRHAFP